MKTVTMLEFRQNAEGVLRRVANGERFVLSHRGEPAARLEPLTAPLAANLASDPFQTPSSKEAPSSKSPRRPGQLDLPATAEPLSA